MNNDAAETLFADKSLATASFRKATGKRKGEAFIEAGAWWVIDADGHQWCFADGEWIVFTYDDDAYVLQVKRDRRAA